MLQALRISNFAVIEEAEVSFGPGMTVLTGETGAGKSILVDALGLLLGGRSDLEVIRAGCDEAAVEGLFAVDPAMRALLGELGLPDLGDELSIRRVVGKSGRAKAYVNGSLVTVGVLHRLMRGTVDISGQHEHMSLFDASLHRAMVDRLGGLAPALTSYRDTWAALQRVDARIGTLGGDEQQVQARVGFLKFQLDEIDRLAPLPGEEVSLEQERKLLQGAEKRQRAASDAEGWLSGRDGSTLETLGRAVVLVQEAARLDPTLQPIVTSLQSARVELDEGARSLARYVARAKGDPQRLAEVEERLDGLKRLCRKHAAPLEGVLSRRAELAAELDRLENRQEALEALGLERAAALEQATRRASGLSAARVEAAARFERGVREGLAQLAMPKAAFSARVRPSAKLGPEGADDLEFTFSANPGEPQRPLAKVASGGEVSRLFLALKRALAGSDDCRCYVLDEADAGVGGAVAEVVGRMMKDVSLHRQVLCITHLPQVAAFADVHLRIEKEQRRGRTQSKVVPLPAGDARSHELARMLSGVEVTHEALAAANALIRSAGRAARSGPAPTSLQKMQVPGRTRARRSA